MICLKTKVDKKITQKIHVRNTHLILCVILLLLATFVQLLKLMFSTTYYNCKINVIYQKAKLKAIVLQIRLLLIDYTMPAFVVTMSGVSCSCFFIFIYFHFSKEQHRIGSAVFLLYVDQCIHKIFGLNLSSQSRATPRTFSAGCKHIVFNFTCHNRN